MSYNANLTFPIRKNCIHTGSPLITHILGLRINTYMSLLRSQKPCNWRTPYMKFVLIEFCGYILKTRVTRTRVTGIRVTRGPPV